MDEAWQIMNWVERKKRNIKKKKMEGNRGTKPRNKIENEGTLFKCDIYFKINPRKYKKHQFFFCISLRHFRWGRRLISLQFDWFLVFLIKFHNDPQFYQKKKKIEAHIKSWIRSQNVQEITKPIIIHTCRQHTTQSYTTKSYEEKTTIDQMISNIFGKLFNQLYEWIENYLPSKYNIK